MLPRPVTYDFLPHFYNLVSLQTGCGETCLDPRRQVIGAEAMPYFAASLGYRESQASQANKILSQTKITTNSALFS